ncbi:MAG: PAS domain S-box protein [Ignavibacteria bacterium]|jgi:PAS domain S-box-containing protein|nr:PAS domain S-box protein [Ignavibacteria bacterium]MCU7498782.1 PAS domain S-box protein [Ignavibacteria bacterium]MCU7512024.1 PAS domain S-box protein [Ignavibacteria bacterium]MCU7520557.1 PAS domain S-box protein [Ignavibacteria bacterium]MCU7523455.1 PAS domain S-box protein [Ignavibacteria bacterium]
MSRIPKSDVEILSDLFNNIPIGVYMTTPGGKILKANKALMQMMGYDSYEDFLRLDLEDEASLNHGYSRKQFRELLEKNGEVIGLENSWRKENGELIYIRENARIIRDDDGSIVYQGTVEDITERKNLEMNLLEKEVRFRTSIENMLDCFAIFEPVRNESGLITDFIFEYVNEAACRFSGNSRSELINSRLFTKFPDSKSSGLFMNYCSVADSGRPFMKDSFPIGNPAEGRAIRYFDVRIVRLGSGIAVTWREVTEKIQAENSLRQSESRYRTLASNFPNGAVVLFDHDFRYLLAEGKEIENAGFSRDKLLGKTMSETFSPRVCAILNAPYSAAIRGETSMFELDGIAGDCYLVYTVPIKDDLGVVVAGMAMFQNITHMKNIEKELKEINASKDKFFSIISHDLKSPFSSLLGFSEFLASDFEQLSPEEVKTFAQNIYKSAKSVFDLLENLLQWSRLQTGGMEYSPVRFNLEELIDDIYNIYEISAIRKKIRLNINTSGPVEVYADKNMIETVLRNLVSNAIKFTGAGGEVEIKVEKSDLKALVSVKDSGVGISPENQKKLFEIGEKLSTPGTDRERGTGLGLIISKEFIDKNNGILNVKSDPDKGSCFSFALPEFRREIELKF